MIKLENVVLASERQMQFIIQGMRNPLNSWEKSDSEACYENDKCTGICSDSVIPLCIGENDKTLMQRLSDAGTDHRKFMRMMPVYVRIMAPLYWWKEFDVYKVGTVSNSCSTMHKIHEKQFDRSDFSVEHIVNCDEQHWMVCIDNVISSLNVAREKYLETKDKKYWWQMIQLLPSSYNQTRNVMLNYEVLANIYKSRRNHKLDEWREFCRWIESLPHSELITGNNRKLQYADKENLGECVESVFMPC